MKYLNKISWSKISFENLQISNLLQLRKMFLLFAYIITLIASIVLLIINLNGEDQLFLIIRYFIIVFSVVGLLLIWKSYISFAEILLPIVVFTAYSAAYFSSNITVLFFIIGITLHINAVSFITNKKSIIITGYLTCLIIITYTLNKSNYEWLDIILIILVHFIFLSIVQRLITNLEINLKQSITKSNELNKKLKIKNEETQMFVNIMAHDVKSPLRSITGFNQLLKIKIDKLKLKDDSIDTYLSYIDNSSKQLSTMIDDILSKARAENTSHKYETIDIKELIETQLFKLKYQIDVSEINIELKELKTIYGDRRSLVILFSNIISNAIKYMPNEPNHKGRIHISQTEENLLDIITIRDNGIGMEGKYLETIFQPFKRLHTNSEYDGTGLGLSVCKTIVEKHNGIISVESKPGKGTCFRVQLPKNDTSDYN